MSALLLASSVLATACVTIPSSPLCSSDEHDSGPLSSPDAATPDAGPAPGWLGPSRGPRATTRVEIAVQLGVYDYGPSVPFDPADPSSTSRSAVSVALYDSLGGIHFATIYFHSDGALSFSWHAMIDGGDISGGTSGVAIEIDAGTLQCDTTGRLTSIGPAGGGSWDFRQAAPGQTVSWSFAGVPGWDGTWVPSRCAGTYSVLAIEQDGQPWSS